MRVVRFLLDLFQVCWREQTDGLRTPGGKLAAYPSPLGTVLEVLLSGISWVGKTVLRVTLGQSLAWLALQSESTFSAPGPCSAAAFWPADSSLSELQQWPRPCCFFTTQLLDEQSCLRVHRPAVQPHDIPVWSGSQVHALQQCGVGGKCMP